MSVPPDVPIDLTHSPEHPLPAPLNAEAPAPRAQSRPTTSSAAVFEPRRTRSFARRTGQPIGPEASPTAAPPAQPPRKRVKRERITTPIPEAPAESSSRVGPSTSTGTGSRVLAALEAQSSAAAGAAPATEAKSSPPRTAVETEDLALLADAITCPICMSPPTDAAITPCGHILCGECLMLAVHGGIQRGRLAPQGAAEAQCPVCRARIDGWDGRGGGIIGLALRVADAL
ncbi:hypothetical protein EXIGLDRAFT_730047 [Exidia glandulosa HHB12029]|uniref:RING-type domain-containing protein n=1 Tax=Exidia glandulosa HHB12029 TaxID=1314781 RepID=A0A165LBY6_EXIGL|nr:hypothetical protein EXIGLDRAFT_730047 [Exidia glandulosa HHB12029]